MHIITKTLLQFWFNFGDDIISEEADHSKRLLSMYSAVFRKLVEVLLRKIMYPSDDAWQTWSDDQRAEFENYRKEVCISPPDALNVLAVAEVV